MRVWDGRRHSARFLAATTHAPLRAIKMRCPRFLFFLALVALCVASANALGGLGGVGGGVGDLADDAAEAAEEAFSPPSAVFEEEEEEPSGGGLFGGIASPSGGGLFGSPFEEEEEVIEEDPCECPAFEGCEVYEGQQVCMVDPSCPTATPTYRSFPGTHYVPCPLDVDCEGSWGNFGACEGQQRCRTFTVTIPGSGTGNACPNTDGEEECDSEGCAPPEPAPLPVPAPELTSEPETEPETTSATAFAGEVEAIMAAADAEAETIGGSSQRGNGEILSIDKMISTCDEFACDDETMAKVKELKSQLDETIDEVPDGAAEAKTLSSAEVVSVDEPSGWSGETAFDGTVFALATDTSQAPSDGDSDSGWISKICKPLQNTLGDLCSNTIPFPTGVKMLTKTVKGNNLW